ncbi:B3 domain-containing protein Os03g0619600-like [Aegilops tauschii subsp. strangulata]|uniref:B3 domain-containing protein Os03g0619600-like n=1 Tax=Aegilops tauschii subsp. strangulata TaxID=200361 RepID=UPI003CC8A5CD
MVTDAYKMSNPCECCQSKLKFIRQINRNFMHSMVLPEWFVNQLGGKIWRTIKLQAPNGIIYDVGVTENMNRIILKLGYSPLHWSLTIEDFVTAEDNSVESDDLQKLSNYYVLSGQCYLTESQEVNMLALVKKIRPEIPMLVVQMKKSNVKQGPTLVIRKDYALEHLPCKDTNIILQLPRKNKDWHCRFTIRPSGTSDAGRRNLSLGNFVHDNHVREGDIYLFEPMANAKQKRFTMIAHLLHKESIDHSPGARTDIGSNHGRTSKKMAVAMVEPPTDGEEYSSEHEELGVPDDSEGGSEPPFMLPDKSCLTPAQKEKVFEKVNEIKSELPLYVAVMSKSNMGTNFHVSPSLRHSNIFPVLPYINSASARNTQADILFRSLLLAIIVERIDIYNFGAPAGGEEQIMDYQCATQHATHSAYNEGSQRMDLFRPRQPPEGGGPLSLQADEEQGASDYDGLHHSP